MSIRLMLVTYPILVMATLYLVVDDCFQAAQGQRAPQGFCTDEGEGLSADERTAMLRAKEWIEETMMGNAVSLDARYKISRRNGRFDVHVVFVSGYSPTGKPLYLPRGHCHLCVNALGEVESPMPLTVETRDTLDLI